MRILVEPKNAIIKQQRKLFSRWDCELQFSESALRAIAKEALRRGGSARHLKSVISELLLDANYESPGSVSEEQAKRAYERAHLILTNSL
jgi:ATP-dependent Clp protease ATP-binding subunit ClpX